MWRARVPRSIPRPVYSVPCREARACSGERPDPSWGSPGVSAVGISWANAWGSCSTETRAMNVWWCVTRWSPCLGRSRHSTLRGPCNGVARRAGGGGLGGHVPSRSGARRAGRVPTKGRRFASTNVASCFNNHGSLIVIKTPTRPGSAGLPRAGFSADFSRLSGPRAWTAGRCACFAFGFGGFGPFGSVGVRGVRG